MTPRRLFEVAGLEIEYMIVDAPTLDVRPLADRLLAAGAGSGAAFVCDVERGAFGWSNELCAHLVELKTEEPVADLASSSAGLADEVRRMNELLAPLGARLLPTGMHPWMNPAREAELWPHEGAEIYAAYDRIFDCR